MFSWYTSDDLLVDPLAQASYERNKKYNDSEIMNKPVEACEKMKQVQKYKLVAPGDVEEFLLHEESSWFLPPMIKLCWCWLMEFLTGKFEI